MALVFSYEEVRNMSEQETDFDDYLKRYCQTYKISPEEAKKQQLVKDVQAYYVEKYALKIE